MWTRDQQRTASALRRVWGTRAFTLHNPRGDLAAQPLKAEQRVGARLRDLDALDGKMLAEEFEMRRALMELLWRQHGRENRNLRAKLHVHQRLDHGVGDKFMAIDAAIYHEPGCDNRGVAPRFRQQLRMQRYLERARHLEEIDLRACNVALLDLLQERYAALFDDGAMPGGLHERDPLRF